MQEWHKHEGERFSDKTAGLLEATQHGLVVATIDEPPAVVAPCEGQLAFLLEERPAFSLEEHPALLLEEHPAFSLEEHPAFSLEEHPAFSLDCAFLLQDDWLGRSTPSLDKQQIKHS